MRSCRYYVEPPAVAASRRRDSAATLACTSLVPSSSLRAPSRLLDVESSVHWKLSSDSTRCTQPSVAWVERCRSALHGPSSMIGRSPSSASAKGGVTLNAGGTSRLSPPNPTGAPGASSSCTECQVCPEEVGLNAEPHHYKESSPCPGSPRRRQPSSPTRATLRLPIAACRRIGKPRLQRLQTSHATMLAR